MADNKAKKYGLIWQYIFKFGKTKEDAMRIARGISTVSFEADENTEDYYYLDGGGSPETAINGVKYSFSFEGHREFGDEFQNYIFDEAQYDMDKRKGFFSIEYPNGKVLSGDATIVLPNDLDGEAEERTNISFEIVFDGKPEVSKVGDPLGK